MQTVRPLILVCFFFVAFRAVAGGQGEGEGIVRTPGTFDFPDVLERPGGGYANPTIDLEIDAAEPGNTAVVNAIIAYDLSLRFVEEYYRIQRLADDKIWLEGHVGLIREIRFDDTLEYYGPSVTIRVNLVNPKQPYAATALAKIYTMDAMAAAYGIPIPDQDRLRVASIRESLEAYENERWFKRLAIGIGFPYMPTDRREDEYETTSYDFGNFLFEYVYGFVAYDPVDFISFHVGTGMVESNENLIFGITFDLTTPIRSSADGFRNWVERLSGVTGY